MNVHEPQAPDNASANEPELDVPKSPAKQDGSAGNAKTRSSVISTANDVVGLAQEITTKAPADPNSLTATQIESAFQKRNKSR